MNLARDILARHKEPEFVYVVASEHCEMFEQELERAHLYVVEYPSTIPSQKYLTVTVPDELYRETAEQLKIMVEAKYSDTMLEYKKDLREKFYPFTQRQKHFMLQWLVDQEVDLKCYQDNGVLIDFFPLHSSFGEAVEEAWDCCSFMGVLFHWLIASKAHKQLPIFLLGAYFGEKIGMYYAWFSFYTSWLVYISIVGIVVSAFQLYSMSIDHWLIPLYCFLISLWITLMNQLWKRKEAELSHKWGTYDFSRKGTERRDFKYENMINPRTSEIAKKPILASKARSVFASFSTIILGLALIAAAFIGFRIWSSISSTFASSITVGAINGLTICFLNYVYTYLSIWLTDWENHRFEDQWQDSFTIKIFGFQFVNCYISLFAIAFYDGDLDNLAYTVGSIFVVKQFIGNFYELGFPIVWNWWKSRSFDETLEKDPNINKLDLDKKRVCKLLEQNYQRGYVYDPVYDYCEMVIQIGYLTMFSSALPICPFFALLNNLWEIKGIFRISM